jgi:hypothetical protein
MRQSIQAERLSLHVLGRGHLVGKGHVYTQHMPRLVDDGHHKARRQEGTRRPLLGAKG